MDNNQQFNNGQDQSGSSGQQSAYGQGYSQQGYDPNSYGSYSQQGYDPNSYGTYSQQGYDPNSYGSYSQQGYGQQQGYDANSYGQQQGYDPNAYGAYYGQQQGYDANSYGQQQGYDPNAYGAYYGQQQGYDPNAYAAYYNYPQQQYNDPNNPVRMTLNPSNPSTSSNNITLHLDSLYERLNNELSKREEVDNYREIKDFFIYLSQNSAVVNVYSYLTDIGSSIGEGMINMVNNNTISVGSKVISLKYISYIKFNSDDIDDPKINSFFYNKVMNRMSQNKNQNNNTYKQPNDFFNFLQSRKSFNQYVSIVVESSFLTSIENLSVVDINEHLAVLRAEDEYYMVPIEKIVSME